MKIGPIEKGVPYKRRDRKYPLSQMEVDDSFVVEFKPGDLQGARNRLSIAMWRKGKSENKKFA